MVARNKTGQQDAEDFKNMFFHEPALTNIYVLKLGIKHPIALVNKKIVGATGRRLEEDEGISILFLFYLKWLYICKLLKINSLIV